MISVVGGVVAGLGILLLIAAAAWRRRSRVAASRALLAALTAPDAPTRIAALALVERAGLSAHLDLLVMRMGSEHDPRVRRAIADVIARNQWEPMHDPRMVHLRLWAQRVLSAEQETVGPAGPGTGVPGPAPAFAPASAFAPVLSPAFAPEPALLPHPGQRRAQGTVVVPGAGAPAGVSFIRDLIEAGCHVVAVSPDPHSPGLRLAHRFAVLPPASDPDFAARLCKLAVEVESDVLLPAGGEEVMALSACPGVVQEAGLRAPLLTAGSLQCCRDGLLCLQRLGAAGLAVFPAWSPEDFPAPPVAIEVLTTLDIDPTGSQAGGPPGPWSVMPRSGTGRSLRARSFGDLYDALRKVDGPMVRRDVVGRPFAADLLVQPDGALCGAVTSWLDGFGDAAVLGPTFHDDALSALLGRAVAVLDLLGLVQVEGVIDADGNAWIASVSPGPSAMLPLARQAGAELVGQYLRLARGETIDPHRLAYRDGVVLQGWRGSATS